MSRILVIWCLLALVAGCDQNFKLERSYCDTEVSYDIWKLQDGGYELKLRVGSAADVSPLACRNRRKINLSQNVSSQEEADKLIDKYRQLYAEKVAAERVAGLPTPAPSPLDDADSPPCDQCP